MKIELSVKTIPFIILVITAFFLCFWNLSESPIAVWDEYTNFNVIYDTVESENPLILKKNDWFIYSKECRLNTSDLEHDKLCSYEKYTSNYFLEKPPLWYYLTIFSSQLFGINNFSVRLVSAISGFLLIILTFYLGKKFFSYTAGIIAGFTLLATRHLFIQSEVVFSSHTLRSADLDSLQLLFIILTSIAFFKFHKLKNIRWLIFAGVFSGLGFLTKGPNSLLPILVFSIFKLINHNKYTLKQITIQLIIVTCTLIIVCVPWYLFMYLKFGNSFIDTYFGYHLLGRGASAFEGHKGNVLFYVKLLFHKEFLLSGVLFSASTVYLISKYKLRITKHYSLFYCLMIIFLTLIATAVIQTKLSWYIFPLYPFTALLVGKFFNDFGSVKNTWVKYVSRTFVISSIIIQICINLHDIIQS